MDIFLLFLTLLSLGSHQAKALGAEHSPHTPAANGFRNWRPDHSHSHLHSRWGRSTGPQPSPPAYNSTNGTCDLNNSAPPRHFWMANYPAVRDGMSPVLSNYSSSSNFSSFSNTTKYQVFRNVKDFGAVGDGVSDDTAAINRAITAGGRESGGKGPGGTTGQPALIYLPPGDYLVSSKIQMFVDTQVIGDAIDLPTIKAASNTTNNTVILNGFDPGTESTTNFYIAIRNLNIDTTSASSNMTIYALNWAVSQATSLTNTNFILGTKHVGIQMNGGDSGGGSGLIMGDLTFNGGLVGIQYSNQQYLIKNVKFTNVGTGIEVYHAFAINLQGIECTNVGKCVDMSVIDTSGSMSMIDSSCVNCGILVDAWSSVLLENIKVTNTDSTLTADGSSKLNATLEGKTYVQGHIYQGGNSSLTTSHGTYLPYTNRGNLVDSSGRYFTKPQPQYANLAPSAFASVKQAGAKGDGQTDDTAAIQAALLANADCKVTYFPFGIYKVTDTLYVPPGSRIVGEVWSTITASGDKFKDAENPHVMIQVGKEGEVGMVEFTDMLFTVADVLPGAILVEVNMKGAHQGDVSFHNTHYRIGGAADSKTQTKCQTESDPCPAAFLLTHLKPSSSVYLENAWLWAADHDLDGDHNQQIGTGRGILVESQGGTWLVGTGSEHHTLYAYQFNNAQNVYAGLMQVESPYWQPTPKAPKPWTPSKAWSDPTFEGCPENIPQCNMQWALRIIGSETQILPLYGPAFWVFFNGPYYGGCTFHAGAICQTDIVNIGLETPGHGVRLYNLNTKAVQSMVTLGESGGYQAAWQDANSGSWGGALAAYLGFE